MRRQRSEEGAEKWEVGKGRGVVRKVSGSEKGVSGEKGEVTKVGPGEKGGCEWRGPNQK